MLVVVGVEEKRREEERGRERTYRRYCVLFYFLFPFARRSIEPSRVVFENPAETETERKRVNLALTPRTNPPLDIPEARVLICPAAHVDIVRLKLVVDCFVGDVC